jgi:DNA-binding NtrC family response regulator
MVGNVLVIDPDKKHRRGFRQVLASIPLSADFYESIDSLPTRLDISRYRAVIIDLDDQMPSKATFETWRRKNIHMNIMGFSSKSFHPDHGDIIGQHLFACLKKPVDPDELAFLLKSILERFEDSEAAT